MAWLNGYFFPDPPPAIIINELCHVIAHNRANLTYARMERNRHESYVRDFSIAYRRSQQAFIRKLKAELAGCGDARSWQQAMHDWCVAKDWSEAARIWMETHPVAL